MVQLLWKIVTQFLKLHQLPCDPAISLLGIHPRERKTCVFIETCSREFIGSSLHYRQLWRAFGMLREKLGRILTLGQDREVSAGRNLILD